MKSSPGKPRARRPVQKKPVQLNLRRTPTWPEENETNEQPEGHFWRWFALVLFLHIVAFVVLLAIFRHQPKPPEQFISLLPPGETVQGTPGPATAPKIAPTQPAPSHATVPQPPPPKPLPKPTQPQPAPAAPKPPPILTDKSSTPAPPVAKPKPKPKPIKVKVDLSLQDAPDVDQPAPTPAPKPKAKSHLKKPTHKATDSPAASTDSETQGLSREEVAQKLGDAFKDSGTDRADKTGVNGSEHSRQSDFSDFYQSIHDQVMNKWSVPNLVDATAIDPIVQIHVDQDGRVPPDRVSLLRSSNNPAFDQSALEAARGMGYTLQPLPDGCPPDISITFNLRQQ